MIFKSCVQALLCLLFFISINGLSQEKSSEDFEQYYDLIYQIKVVAKKAGSKSSIGSGFQISESGLIVTNYHVISSYVQFPDKNEIIYESETGKTGKLKLIEFDVINDIALLEHPNPAERFLALSEKTLNKGETIYALGNPSDFGIKLVSGANNGLADHRYDEEILFSASLNGGMSGGPALNSSGEVVGVNVSTAGGQLSFLVPVSKVKEMVAQVEVIGAQDFQSEITKQIKHWQRKRIAELIDSDWQVESFAGKELFGEIRLDFKCWGRTNEDNIERRINRARKRCSTGNVIYLDNDINTGNIVLWFRKLESIKLNSIQFSETIKLGMYGSNKSNYETSSNFECLSDFIDNGPGSEEDEYNLVSTCIRRYKKLTGLFDSLMRVDMVKNGQSFSALLGIYGVEKDQIQSLNSKFIGKIL